MATMNIKDPEIHRMARDLAERKNTTMTGAVRAALQEALARQEARKSGTAQRLLALGSVSREIAEPVLTDDELYDQHGLPG
ncbi:MAG TPA: type II toxin-antitoxin system VapB family antitoxin [Jiangellaceae bacterium]|nr:type II toxin-antitoxin system VapB family antitoxin [Jiangellaceae bacterium]